MFNLVRFHGGLIPRVCRRDQSVTVHFQLALPSSFFHSVLLYFAPMYALNFNFVFIIAPHCRLQIGFCGIGGWKREYLHLAAMNAKAVVTFQTAISFVGVLFHYFAQYYRLKFSSLANCRLAKMCGCLVAFQTVTEFYGLTWAILSLLVRLMVKCTLCVGSRPKDRWKFGPICSLIKSCTRFQVK